MSGRLRRIVAVSVVLVVVAVVAGLFVVDVDSTAPEPAPFDDTVSVGLSAADQHGLDADVELPKAQVYYSQYEYVVGYYGVETFVETQRTEGYTQRFGYPLVVYVSDYSSVDVDLTEEGHPVTDGQPGWTDAEGAWYVTDSEASTPTGETVVPFSSQADATAFADAHDGTVRSWGQLLETEFDRDEASVVRDRVDDQHADADRRVEATADLRDRPISTVVGEGSETIQEAIEEAPANTTIRVPEGEYEETLEIERPLTLLGDGDVTIRGDGNGSVVTATADRTGLVGLEITGSGAQRTGADELPGDDPEDEEWDATFEQNYAGGDAGIAMHTASDSLVEDVTVHSSASGIIIRRGGESVVRNATVYSPEAWTDGHAGILTVHSPIVVEESTVYDGRDGLYAHQSEELVVRDSTFDGNRLGVHLMHTSEALVAANDVHDQVNTGIYVMTGPERNALVDNDVRSDEYAIFVSGSDSYVAGNVLTDSRVGLRIDSTGTIYEHNVVAGNEIGAKERSLLPTNQVYANDFVDNDVHGEAGTGPLRIWTEDGVGNYWQGPFSLESDERTDRAYSPTAPVDQRLHRVDGTPTLARSPALDAMAGLQGSVPGMRTGSSVDLAPTCEPNNPDLLEGTAWEDRAWSCDRTTTP
ncbi:NosD domain-containing protein [Natronobacterium gregoryi]|uniref:Nitrous oxidase accessory protein n=2 Tax=Natronobacterium gregoryi TaxID=44930 RepID=L0AJE4_NATGS|nr:NosD domain-containing protein [Natronobacterium gregoryi]AFZ73564.1 nitrous oxidase accessory protein [Natronobacterium gregoryi SP2]ELY68231.1 NosL family protein [Natronobacterium gregoryi SP2]PLK20536.1 nitrous oxide reductase accessory protein NosL/NosD [Natronobacterium gregoryi SP2]SFJ17794.1 Nitrous oxidase accessory protein NosD, contains tandem CASH domains [Natronobacterium gregoryi]